MKKDILVLGIESSCDETSVAVVKNGRELISNSIASQIDIHKLYGGVVPEIASRNHIKNIMGTLHDALAKANVSMDDIDAIAVTYGAGLLGALIVGVSFAKALAYATGKPLYAVNHIEGHIAANYLAHPDLKPPFCCLVVSGGHTALFEMKNYVNKKLLITTTDDAIGEAFDKVARECGLLYPGGPNIQRQAQSGTPDITFVNPALEVDFNHFSYSGLKTAVINYLHNKKQKNEEINVPNVCASFQKEAVAQLVTKTFYHLNKKKAKTLVLAGGVSANAELRKRFAEEGEKYGIKVYFPPLVLCTDNAGMVACQGYYNLISGKKPSKLDLEPMANLPLSSI